MLPTSSLAQVRQFSYSRDVLIISENYILYSMSWTPHKSSFTKNPSRVYNAEELLNIQALGASVELLLIIAFLGLLMCKGSVEG